MDLADMQTLLDHAHANGKTVLVAGFSEAILPLAAKADGFVSCTPISVTREGSGDEELRTLEVAGGQYSTSCTQAVKEQAQILIPRPSHGRGGLASLALAMRRVKEMTNSLSAFQSYWIWTQLIRMTVTVIPMLLGQTILDARHILFCGCLMDGFAFWIFSGKRSAPATDRLFTGQSYWTYAKANRPMLWAALASSASCFLLPRLLELTGLTEQFLYQSEFFFTAVILLHLTVLLLARFGTSAKAWRNAYRDLPLVALVAVVALFLLTCVLYLPFGVLFAWEENPLPYFLLSLLPSAIFVIVALATASQVRHRRRA
jgi:magnesium-transporting ATPase (P-type)